MQTAGNVTPSYNDGSRSPAGTVNQASTGAHHMIDKVAGASRPLVDRIASRAHRAVDRIASEASQAAETLSVKGEQLKHAQERAMARSRGYVRDNPVMAVGIALAAGYFVSRLLRSR